MTPTRLCAALLVAAAVLPPPLAVRHLDALERADRDALAGRLRAEAALAAAGLRALVAAGGPQAPIAAGAAMGAVDAGAVRVRLLLRRAAAAPAGFFHLGGSGDADLDDARRAFGAAPLLGALDDTCAAGRTRMLAPDAGRPALAALVPLQGPDGCWVVMASAESVPAAGAGGLPLAAAGLASLALLAAAALLARRRPPSPPPSAVASPPAAPVRADPPVRPVDGADLSAFVGETALRLAAAHGGRVSIALAAVPALRVAAPPHLLPDTIGRLLDSAVAAAPAGALVGLRLERRDGTVWLAVENGGPVPPPLAAGLRALGWGLREEAPEDAPSCVTVVLPAATAANDGA